MAIHELTGKINEQITLTVSKPHDWFQTNDIPVNLSIALDQKSAWFTPSVNGIYAIECGEEDFIIKVGELPPIPEPDPQIPPIEVPPVGTYPPAGTVIDLGISFNQPVRTLTKHGEIDKYDHRIEARAGSNRKITIGNNKMIIDGDQVRTYFLIPNYNAQLDYDRTFEDKANTEDDGSDDLCSRHNEGEIKAEAYNKIGGQIVSEELGGNGKWKREDVHGTYDTIKKYTAPKVSNGQKHHVTYILTHDDAKKTMRAIRKIDGHVCLDAVDSGAPDTFFDIVTIKRKSYFRIRNNGEGRTIVENPKLTILA